MKYLTCLLVLVCLLFVVRPVYATQNHTPTPKPTPTVKPCLETYGYTRIKGDECLTPTASPTQSPTARPSATPTATPSATPTLTPFPTPTIVTTTVSDGKSDGHTESLGCQRPEDNCGQAPSFGRGGGGDLPATGSDSTTSTILIGSGLLIAGLKLRAISSSI